MTERSGHSSRSGLPRHAAANGTGPDTASDSEIDTAIDTTVAHTSRIYDYLLGGTNHFAVDREVAHHAFDAYPGGFHGVRADARANRAFLGRVVRHLAGEVGIRQFLDIGTGIPTLGNVHQIAQQVAPEARVVYVDNDPIVLAHAHSLLESTPSGVTKYIHCDLREPDVILKKAAATLDLTEPIALVLIGLLHVIPDEDDPHGHVAHLVDAVVPGSYLAISHINRDVNPQLMAQVNERLDRAMSRSNPPAFRTLAEIARFFDGLELVDPGLVPVNRWRPGELMPPSQHPAHSSVYGAVARKQ